MCRASCKMFNIRREFFKVPFTIICIFGAVLMVGYWFYKFGIEDRDIGVVDYVSLDKTKDFKRPDFAICFSHFILVNKLIEANPNVTPAMYFHYLIGNNAYDQFLNIDYENVTLDLKNYLIKNMIKDSNGNFIRLNSYDLIHKTIFNGFHKNGFVKCFTTAIKQIEPLKDVEEFHLSYNKTKIFDDLGLPRDKILPIHTNVFYPGQFLLEVNRMKYHAMHGRKSGGANVFIQSIEMLKRRNSHNKKCHENGEFYDDMVIQKHVQSIGCRAPYIAKYQSFPICTNSLDVKNSKMDFYQTRKQYFLKACQRISKIQDAVVHFNNADGKWTLSVIYPDEIKIITQSKEVDGHTLVGNIGGYIGLFLGYSLIQLPDLIMRISDLLQKQLFSNRTTRRRPQAKAPVTARKTLEEYEKIIVSRKSRDNNTSSVYMQTSDGISDDIVTFVKGQMKMINDRMDKQDKIMETLLNKQ